MRPKRQRALLISALIGVPVLMIGAAWIHFTSDVITYGGIDGGALVSASGRTISVTAGVLCDENAALVADEQQASVSIAVKYAAPRTATCSGMPGFAVYHVQLSQPLGRRRLIDQVSGKPVPFIDVARILRPAYIPPGFMFRYDAPDGAGMFGPEYLSAVVQAPVTCSQLYTTTDNRAALVITQSAPRRLEWPPRTKPRPIVVNGHHGLEAPGELTWIEHGQRIMITVSGLGLSAGDLMAVADSMPR